jgi:hypothetical protein
VPPCVLLRRAAQAAGPASCGSGANAEVLRARSVRRKSQIHLLLLQITTWSTRPRHVLRIRLSRPSRAARAARTCTVISRALAGKRKRAPASWWRRCRPPAPRWPPPLRSSEPPPSTSRAAAPAAECEWMAHVDNFTVQLLHLLLRLPVVTTVSACYYINLLVLVLLLLGRDRVAVCVFLRSPELRRDRPRLVDRHQYLLELLDADLLAVVRL